MAKNILVVEDSRIFAHTIVGKIETESACTASLATSFAHARHLLKEPEAHFDAAVIDLILPDAPSGEVVDYVVERGIPTIALAVIDIDHFKKVNDNYGHAAGDDVLRHVSALLAGQFRESDIVARLGGEEFCVLAPNMDEDHAFKIFDKLRSKIESRPLTTNAGIIGPTVSIGLTATLFDSLEKTLNHADTLLYKAKASGRNRVIVG